MKSKLKIRTSAAVILGLIAALTMAPAAVARAADKKNVVNPATSLSAPPAIDPATGLPAPMPAAPWKDPNWKDPEKVLVDVSYNGVALEDVANNLRDQFNGAFDMLIPNDRRDPNNPAVSFDPGSTPIKMQLKNVTASEVFNAMNLVFESENRPLRWELKMNGNRPTVVLRVLGYPYAPTPPEPQRKIYFVGDLIDEEKLGTMTMEQLVKIVSEVYEMSYGTSRGSISSHLQFHKQAQLLVVTGTVDEENFVLQTLVALRDKARAEERKPQPPRAAEAKTKTEAPKTP